MEDIVLVLDAMGVIYTAADDVEELLVPFVKERGGIADTAGTPPSGELTRFATPAEKLDLQKQWDSKHSSHPVDVHANCGRLASSLTTLVSNPDPTDTQSGCRIVCRRVSGIQSGYGPK